LETLKPQDVILLVEKVVQLLKQEGMYVSSCEIREKALKYEVYLKIEKNMIDVSAIKLIFNKNKFQYRVFTGRTSLDLRLKRLIRLELSKMAGRHEVASQKTSAGGSSSTKRAGKVVR